MTRTDDDVAGLLGVALPATASVHGLLQRGVALVAAVWGAGVAYRVLTSADTKIGAGSW